MNIPTITSTISAQWLRRSVAALATVLSIGIVVFGLANRTPIGAPAARVAAAPTSADTRFVAHKRDQVDRLDVVLNESIQLAPAYARFVEHKLAQIDLLDASTARGTSAPSGAYQRFINFKYAQVGE
jgi:hypothetical protein